MITESALPSDDSSPRIARHTETRFRWHPIIIGLLVPLVVFLIEAVLLWNFSIDDVAISYRYARHLVEGLGLTWNPGGAPVEGYSNLLWVLVLAVTKCLGLDIETASKILGVALGGLNLTLLFLICRRIWFPERYWWLPTVLVALTPTWVAWTVSGLEIPLFGCFLLMSAFALTGSPKERAWLLSLGLSGLIVTRPEGFPLAMVVILIVLAADRSQPLRHRVTVHRYPIIAVVGVAAALVVFRLLYYGSPLPNTVYAKFSWVLPGLPEAARWMLFGVPFWIVWIVVYQQRRQLPQRLLLATGLVLVICQVAITLTVVPVMSFLHRYQVAFLPLLVLPVPVVLRRVSLPKAWVGTLAITFLMAWSLQDWLTVRERLAAENYFRRVQRCIVEDLVTLPDSPTIALVDAGRIPYGSDLPAIDVWGLCERDFARTGFSAAAVVARNPEVYVMSVDVTASGALQPRLGMDRAMMNDSLFRVRYGLWTSCLGGTTTAVWRYDYAILLNIAWAERHAIRVRPID